MGRKKLERVPALDKARTRLAGTKSISPDLDLGNGLTNASYEEQIVLTEKSVSRYNTSLSTTDDLYNDAQAQIKKLNDWNSRILIGVASKFTTDSSEYEMAGGVRKSERKKPTPKTKK